MAEQRAESRPANQFGLQQLHLADARDPAALIHERDVLRDRRQASDRDGNVGGGEPAAG